MIPIGPRPLRGDSRWRRWTPVSPGWSEPSPGLFACSTSEEAGQSLRYRHVVADPEQWQAIKDGNDAAGSAPVRP